MRATKTSLGMTALRIGWQPTYWVRVVKAASGGKTLTLAMVESRPYQEIDTNQNLILSTDPIPNLNLPEIDPNPKLKLSTFYPVPNLNLPEVWPYSSSILFTTDTNFNYDPNNNISLSHCSAAPAIFLLEAFIYLGPPSIATLCVSNVSNSGFIAPCTNSLCR